MEHTLTRRFLLAGGLAALAAPAIIKPKTAATQTSDRFITLNCLNTGVSYSGVYRRGNRHLTEEFTKAGGINRVLWDWRQRQTIQMDPAVIDFMYDVAQRCNAGPRPVFEIVSGYRSLATIRQLRTAIGSQHRYGRAVDFYIHGIRTIDLVRAAVNLRRGGVGDYSGRPAHAYVHVDTRGHPAFWRHNYG